MQADFVFNRKQQEVFLSAEKYFSTFQKPFLLRADTGGTVLPSRTYKPKME